MTLGVLESLKVDCVAVAPVVREVTKRIFRGHYTDMLGKRPRTMRRTSSVSLIGSGSVNGDSSPLPEQPKEKVKSSNCTSPSACAPRLVIGFHPKVSIGDELELAPPISPRVVPQSNKSPGGSPRSGLGDLLAGRPPWGRKDEGVGLGIVAAISASPEEVGKVREDVRPYTFMPVGSLGYGRKTSPPAHLHSPSVFAPSRTSPPIPIQPSSICMEYPIGGNPNYGHTIIELSHSVENGSHRGGASRHHSSSSGISWAKPTVNVGGISSLIAWGQVADMEVETPSFSASFVKLPRQQPYPSSDFIQNFMEACHLCKRVLGDGLDIYIYRGDKAFCSPECRHQQILNDECFEKCSSAIIKMNGAPASRSTSHRSRVAGTAAAA